MCTLNSFYLQNFLQNFLHTPYYTVHGPVPIFTKVRKRRRRRRSYD